jgi:uncharacterized protein involved in exopolysaccharide biosynthesis
MFREIPPPKDPKEPDIVLNVMLGALGLLAVFIVWLMLHYF